MSLTGAVAAQTPPGTGACEDQIVFSKFDGTTDLYLLGIDDARETRLTVSGHDLYLTATQPGWSPQGERLVFSGQVNEPAGGSAYNMDIFAVNVNGVDLERLTTAPSSEVRPTISPDGDRIAFASDRDGNWEIYVMDVTGNSAPVNLTTSAANDGERGIAWSPEGARIAFVTDQGHGPAGEGRYEEQQIYLLDGLDSGGERRSINLTASIDICPAGEFYSSPAWSNSGRRLAFALGCGELYDVYVMDVAQDGTVMLPPVNLTEEGQTSTTNDGFLGLNWSPDDGQIVYVSSPQGQGNSGGELWLIAVGERGMVSRPRQLTHFDSSEVFVASPTWRPCQTEE